MYFSNLIDFLIRIELFWILYIIVSYIIYRYYVKILIRVEITAYLNKVARVDISIIV